MNKNQPKRSLWGIFCFLTYNWQAIFIFHVHRLLPCRASSNCDGEFKLYRAHEAVCMYYWDYMNKRKEKYIWTLSVTNIYTFPLTDNLHNIIWSTFFCQLPSLAHARLFSAAASPFSRLRSDCSLEITHSLRKTKETKQHKTSLTTNLTTNLTLTMVHKKRKRIN